MEKRIEPEASVSAEHETVEEKTVDIQKVYIKNYGNLTLEVRGTNDIGMQAYSAKRDEILFIPWTSIIMVSDKIN